MFGLLAFFILVSGGTLTTILGTFLFEFFSDGIAILLLIPVMIGVVALMGATFTKGLLVLADSGWFV